MCKCLVNVFYLWSACDFFDVLVSHFSFGWNLLVIYSRFTFELLEIYLWFTWDLLVAYLRFTCGTKFVICFLEPFCNDLTKSFSIVSTSDIYLCFLQAHSCSKSFGEHTGASNIKGLTSGSCSTISSSSPSTLVVSASFTKAFNQSWGVAFPNPELLPFALALGLDLSSFGVLLLVCTFIALLAGFFILPVLGFGVGVFFGVAPFLGALTLVPGFFLGVDGVDAADLFLGARATSFPFSFLGVAMGVSSFSFCDFCVCASETSSAIAADTQTELRKKWFLVGLRSVRDVTNKSKSQIWLELRWMYHFTNE